MMAKFKVGDRVRVIDNSGAPRYFKVGDEFNITRIDSDCLFFGDLIYRDNEAMFAERFELVSTPKFKVGDRVHYGDEVCSGVGTIVERDNPWAENVVFVLVDPKDAEFAYFDGARYFDASSLSLITSPTAIVASTAGPARNPRIHASREDAAKEAERLAKLHPGQEFAVYERVSAVVADVTLRAVA